MTPEQHASLLADWLEKPPGTPPPEGLDPESVEACYALRPELAPAPTVSLDDILAGVSEGPFARIAEVPISEVGAGPEARVAELPISEADEEIVEEADPETGRGEVVDFAAARRRRQRIWGGVGVVAAAALVLFTVFPEGDQLENLAVEDMPAEVAAPAKSASDDVVNAEAVALDTAVAADPAPAAAKAPPPAEARSRSSRGSSSNRDIDELSSGRYDTLDLEEEAGADDFAELKAASEGDAASYGPAPEQEVWEQNAAPAQDLAEEPALADYGDYREAADELDQSGSGGGIFDRQKKNQRPTRSTSSEPSTGSIDYDAPAGEPEPIPSDIDGLRAAASPGDYSSSWYLRSLSDDELDRFDAAVASGDYASLIDDDNALIGQDMAFRAASAALGSDASVALNYARRGQARSSANTAFRANLYYVEGLALERRGDIEGAKRAYTTAANLNRAR